VDERNKKIFYCLIGRLQTPAFNVLYLHGYFHHYKWELCICSEGSIYPKTVWDNYMSQGILTYEALLLNPVARGSRKVTLTLVKYIYLTVNMLKKHVITVQERRKLKGALL